MSQPQKILFLGAGKMGSAILRGLLSAGKSPQDVAIFEPHTPTKDALVQELSVPAFESRQEAMNWADAIVLAVKPQIWKTLGAELAAECTQSKIFVSIMAGIKLTDLSEALPLHQVIRTMPNLPLTVGKGAVGYCLNTTDSRLVEVVQTLFGAIGTTTQITESQMDALTGLSGSGPAYVFQMIEGMVQGGVLCGLTRTQAEELTYQTMLGSLELWQASGKNPGELTAEVCSPGGTTIAGIQVLEDRSLRGTLMQAIQAATERSKALA